MGTGFTGDSGYLEHVDLGIGATGDVVTGDLVNRRSEDLVIRGLGDHAS